MRLATTRASRRRSPRISDLLGAFGHRDRRVGKAADGDRVTDELGHEQLLEVQSDRAGIEAADLEQVLDETLEPRHVSAQEVERSLGALGHLVAPALHHLDRGRQRHQRGAELVTDVGRESGVTLDAQLQGRCHVVERVGEHAEVGVVGRFEARVETPTGDRLGRLGGDAHGSHGATSGEDTEQHPEAGGDDPGEQEGEPNAPERAVDLVEAEELEVGVVVRERPPDDDRGLVPDAHRHA